MESCRAGLDVARQSGVRGAVVCDGEGLKVLRRAAGEGEDGGWRRRVVGPGCCEAAATVTAQGCVDGDEVQPVLGARGSYVEIAGDEEDGGRCRGEMMSA
ncbi:hypothetical protein KSP40_PGU009807 [Platanthera guangdongensis]|uniref:Uncharacterized protein n=1 Tax=Platanthera guangdongensis TaxID=2320717 RepID=A0ABR2MUZ1_9ASPA